MNLIKTLLLSILFISPVAKANNFYSYQVFSPNPDRFQNIDELQSGVKIIIPHQINYVIQTNQDIFNPQTNFHPVGNFQINTEKKAWASLVKNTHLTLYKKLDNHYLPKKWKKHFSNHSIQYEIYMAAVTNGGGKGYVGLPIEKQKALDIFQDHSIIKKAFVGNAYFIPYSQNIHSVKNSWKSRFSEDEISKLKKIYLAVVTNGGGATKKQQPLNHHKDMNEMAYLIPQNWMNGHSKKQWVIDNNVTDVILATKRNQSLF